MTTLSTLLGDMAEAFETATAQGRLAVLLSDCGPDIGPSLREAQVMAQRLEAVVLELRHIPDRDCRELVRQFDHANAPEAQPPSMFSAVLDLSEVLLREQQDLIARNDAAIQRLNARSATVIPWPVIPRPTAYRRDDGGDAA